MTHAIVSVSTHQLQVYDADLRVIADFHGLRYCKKCLLGKEYGDL